MDEMLARRDWSPVEGMKVDRRQGVLATATKIIEDYESGKEEIDMGHMAAFKPVESGEEGNEASGVSELYGKEKGAGKAGVPFIPSGRAGGLAAGDGDESLGTVTLPMSMAPDLALLQRYLTQRTECPAPLSREDVEVFVATVDRVLRMLESE